MSPFDSGQCLAVMGDAMVAAFVARLFGKGSPLAVFGTVGAVVINSFKRMRRRWTRPHVRQELFKCVPSRINGDTPTAIPSIGGRRGPRAAHPHTIPDPILGGFAEPMSLVPLSDQLASKAPTRQGITYRQSRAFDRPGHAAFTTADPVVPVPGRMAEIALNDGPSTKTVAGRYGTLLLHRTPPTSGAQPVRWLHAVRASSRQFYHRDDFKQAQSMGLDREFWASPRRVA